MAYSALIVESGMHARNAASPKSKDDPSGSPTDPLASPWLSHCSYYRATSEFISGGARRNLEARFLGQQEKRSTPTT